jgi:hypothetical protein
VKSRDVTPNQRYILITRWVRIEPRTVFVVDKQNKHMKKHVHLLVLVLVWAACRRDDNPAPTGPKAWAAKVQDTLALGESVRLSPLVNPTAGVSYQWQVNGVVSGTDSAFTFQATQGGNFRVVLRVSNNIGSDSLVYTIKVWGQYENGFFILNEGWFGTETGSVHYYAYGADTVNTRVYTKENPDKPFGSVATTLQYGSIYNNKLYMVLKAGGPLIVTDAHTLKETGRVESVADGNGMTFVGVDENRGLIGASDGIYPVNLNTLGLGGKIADVSGTVGNMLKSGDYIFAHTANDGLVVLDIATYGIVQKPYKATIGFVQGRDGLVYGAEDSLLISIHPKTLEMDTVKMPFHVVAPWGAWRSVNMTASTKDNVVYIVQPGTGWAYGNKLYRYESGNTASISQPFITLPDGQYFYGSGVTYDPRQNELVITTINGPFSGSTNRLLFYDAASGALKKTVTFEGWYFPAMVVLQP